MWRLNCPVVAVGSDHAGHRPVLSVHRQHPVGGVADGAGFVAVRAAAARRGASAEQVAVWAVSFVGVADLAVGALVGGAAASRIVSSTRSSVQGVTTCWWTGTPLSITL